MDRRTLRSRITMISQDSGQRVLDRDRFIAQRNIIVKQVEDLTKTRYVKPEKEDQFLLQFAKVQKMKHNLITLLNTDFLDLVERRLMNLAEEDTEDEDQFDDEDLW